MMSTRVTKRERELELEIELASLRSHEKHMKYIYGVRLAGLTISAITIIAGAVMVFMGLQGSFNWAVEVPNSIGAKLTNASPGIIFATVGLFISFFVILQKPVNYRTGGFGGGGGIGGRPITIEGGRSTHIEGGRRRVRDNFIGLGHRLGPDE
jgi:hypothetical protein